MNEDVKKVKVTPKTQRPRYKWEELEVGEGYPCPYASTQYHARAYMDRLAAREDRPDYTKWEFRSRKDKDGVLHIVRTA
jgi:hypothetical protein